ncbi:MAG: hypothetical protein IJS03_05810 [Eubacterium sp.]|nr:hypothetical protein [Eubacterium sp.]
MMSSAAFVGIIAAIVVLIILGIIVIPLFNKRQFQKMPYDQKVRILMKQAKKLVFFKNVSNGSTGTLYFVKNKRKILALPWVLKEGKMLCTKDNPFDFWDYPEEKPAFTLDEIKQAADELEKYNEKSIVKLYFKD